MSSFVLIISIKIRVIFIFGSKASSGKICTSRRLINIFTEKICGPKAINKIVSGTITY